MNIAITMTTINLPVVLEDYIKNILKYGHQDKTSIIIVGDKKTPNEVLSYCENLSEENNIKIQYFDLEWQKKIFKRF